MQNKNDFQQTDSKQIQWLTFFLNNEVYGIEVLKVREALRPMEIASVPGSPNHVIGIINLRGQVITVKNLRLLLALPDADVTNQSRIILMEVDNQTQGILADGVSEIISINMSEIDYSTIQNDDNEYFMGTYQYGEELIILLSVDTILKEDDEF